MIIGPSVCVCERGREIVKEKERLGEREGHLSPMSSGVILVTEIFIYHIFLTLLCKALHLYHKDYMVY